MATVVFTSALQRFLKTGCTAVTAATVGGALDAVFATAPLLRGYLLDDQGTLRRHVAVYVNGEAVRDRHRLSDPVGGDDQIHVLQALSGG
ncbi:MAG: MoaD/ThiS family protein [Stellaceae bacterium]